MSHMRWDAELGQQVREPAPTEGRFERDLDRLWTQLIDQLLHLGRSSSDLAVEDQLAVRVDCRDLALLAVKVDSDVNHVQGLLPVGCVIGREKSQPLTTGAEARSFIASCWLSSTPKLAGMDGNRTHPGRLNSAPQTVLKTAGLASTSVRPHPL